MADEPRSGLASTSGARRPLEAVIEWSLLASGSLSILVTISIVGVLLFETIEFFGEVPLRDYLFDTEWTPLFADAHFGVWPLVAGTALTAAIAMTVAVPLGLLAAIYMSEYAEERFRRILKPSLEILAGVPTIVYGYFALVFLTPILQQFIPKLSGFNALSPGIIMGIMIVPLVASLSEDALSSVSHGLREAAYGLGANKVPTVFRVVLPAAGSGIAASLVIALSRAIGETMIVTVAAGQQPRLTADPRVPVETMTAYIVNVALGDVPPNTMEYRTLFVVGATLFLFTFVASVFSNRLVRRWRERG